MKKYLDLESVLTKKDLSPFISTEHLKVHQYTVLTAAVTEIEKHLEEDEDLQKEDLETAQETAGFHDLELRHAIGALFNHVFFFGILNSSSAIEQREPAGRLAELINKHFTDYNGLKESFKKVVNARVLPGWVWLGLTKDKQLVITQTNNEDNTLMHGIALVQCLPIIGLDLWEHSYFTQYEGDKEDYVNRFWDFIDWGKVSANFESHNEPTYKLAPLLD
ncbi:superoxide dismutase [Stylonychia lemnae]|uniref:superoxide dismutase n=1 Tax=Stylonychia lemnae TaxID=5949 RepID=A0A078AR99_STYLE|nr:superoxide dismutase [Stylonychia lemnae]|eukprot:CDW84501.1 superoxide dismutase [Stylonychia lemnae]